MYLGLSKLLEFFGRDSFGIDSLVPLPGSFLPIDL